MEILIQIRIVDLLWTASMLGLRDIGGNGKVKKFLVTG